MEIGSFIELELPDSGEFYSQNTGIARLNSGRSGIYHALRRLKCNKIYLPFYLCPSVEEFLKRKEINILKYYISENFEPLLQGTESESAILIVNYFGIMAKERMLKITGKFHNVIIDNCPGFFSEPIPDCFNIYSARKFFGVPDGGYVIGPDAELEINDYQQDESSDTATFLLKRIEKGCSPVYAERMRNEERIDNSDISRMSLLTLRLLKSIDYKLVMKKRSINFHYAHNLFKSYNRLDPEKFFDSNCFPMVYPLVVEGKELADKLKSNNIYTGRLWSKVLTEIEFDSFETYLSRYLIPLPIDQRYEKKHIDYCFKVFMKVFNEK